MLCDIEATWYVVITVMPCFLSSSSTTNCYYPAPSTASRHRTFKGHIWIIRYTRCMARYLTIYNPRDFKYRVRHPLVSTSWRLRECTDFDEWHLKSNLMTWCWNWYDFYVDSPLLSDVAMSWKTVNLAHFAELNIQRYCHHAIWQKISMSYKLSGKTKFSMASCEL